MDEVFGEKVDLDADSREALNSPHTVMAQLATYMNDPKHSTRALVLLDIVNMPLGAPP